MDSNQNTDQAGRVSREQETEWATATAAGRTAAGQLASLPEGERRSLPARTLAREVAAGRRAEAAWVAAFGGMADRAARRHVGRGVELEDLAQEARLRMVTLTRSFKPALGNRFSTYATAALDGALRDLIRATGRSVRIPRDVLDEVRQLAAATAELEAKFGREPSRRELAAALGIDPARVAQVEAWSQPAAPITEALEETLADPEAAEVDAAVSAEDALRDLIAPTRGRAREVLELRLGLRGGFPLTQAEVGAALAITQQAVAAAEERGYAAIRASRAVEF
ncbi:sigma-70 family RNA polymerase sigma factor [Cryobacterium sp. PH31-O1]|uniref:sigma-70 family RNA polymerase sigma factor n=1 Tax=Cryobacterium sp. PH31-O1 TaxID=3046306 RepID=UPI0024B90AB0|nr:sigma-70 family RNA polymerase sigma factor [Cryobacterium sp. PH31-O1]MDJ0338248.1 sigma-70 family RNA polymerase sigma factor [Cryobacterium sp. PH31-O1]